jgi:hypothetical protein
MSLRKLLATAFVGFLLLSLPTFAQVPAAPQLSSPANGAANVPLTVTVSWSAVSSATSYTLQMSSSTAFSSFILNQAAMAGTSQVISDFPANTTCFWRVSATNASATGPWSAIWSFSTLSTPSAPVLSSPANGLINSPLQITASWQPISNATSYEVQFATNSAFSGAIGNSGLIATTYAFGGVAGYTYYWHVNGSNAGGTGPWSAVWSFTIGATPAAPTLVSPSNGAANQPLSLTLQWTSVQGATSYTVAGSFSQSGITATSLPISGLYNNSTYTWSITAVNSFGSKSSATWSFTTPQAIPAVPQLSAPANNATGVSLAPVLSWQELDGSRSFTIQISTSSGFSSTVFSMSSSTLQVTESAALSENAVYFWRALASNTLGTSAWSSIWTFTVSGPAPTGIPELLSPANKASQHAAVNFEWSAVPYATSYVLWVSYVTDNPTTQQQFSQTVQGTSQAINFANYINFATNDATISWSVRAQNGAGPGPSSGTNIIFLSGGSAARLPMLSSVSSSFTLRSSSVLYTLATPENVSVSLFSLSGRRISLLDRAQPSGSYTLSLRNRGLSPGAYLLSFKAGVMEKRVKIVLPGG